MSYKSCGNCFLADDGDCTWLPSIDYKMCDKMFQMWTPIDCPKCGGILSEIREHKGKYYRHCYACHMETEVERKK